NFIQLAYWDWDQIKVFLALFMVFLGIWAWTPADEAHGRPVFWLQLACLGMMYPTLAEVITLPGTVPLVRYFNASREESVRLKEDFRSIFSKGEEHTVYNSEEVKEAARIRKRTLPSDIIQCAP